MKVQEIALVAKLNPAISERNRKQEEKFEYNKDAGLFGKEVQGATTLSAVNFKK
ncbi:hypothetical protein WAX74_18815 [Psychrobacillus sp. FJAT-51614]|uniref:Uncharacterized protein n=2 Tax=Psychrobacillus mangrovi TaxID=3117745 RepID=A0ABU8F9I7_9BACI